MAVIHRTTMTPGKLELLASWLPTQPWYVPTGREPELTKAGGFRLDDPRGEVGIEFMVVTDVSGARPVSYHVPLSYRGDPLDGAEGGLIGTSEHGVLGKRWIYDGTHDPVLVAALLALLQGRAEPQDQSQTDTPDPSVTREFTGTGFPEAVGPATVDNGPRDTELLVAAASGQRLSLAVTRVLEPGDEVSPTASPAALGHVTAGWRLPDGGEVRAPFVILRGAGQ